MFFEFLYSILRLQFIIVHFYIIYYIYRSIVEVIKTIEKNGKLKYLSKAWRILFRHKTLCIYSIFFLIYYLYGVKFAKEVAEKYPSSSSAKDAALNMIPIAIYIFVLRYVFDMSIALNIRNTACGRRKYIFSSMMRSLFYFYPVFLWNRFKKYDILRDDPATFQIKAICFVLENGKYKNINEKAEIMKSRFYLYEVKPLLEVSLVLYGCILLLFSIDIFEMWSWHSAFATIAKGGIFAVIIASMFIETLAVIYTCQLYLWNKKWEETYSAILSQGKSAPNIETVDFPEICRKTR